MSGEEKVDAEKQRLLSANYQETVDARQPLEAEHDGCMAIRQQWSTVGARNVRLLAVVLPCDARVRRECGEEAGRDHGRPSSRVRERASHEQRVVLKSGPVPSPPVYDQL